MGLMLSRLIDAILGVTASIATVSKRGFSGLRKWLFAGVIVMLVAGLANIFLQIPALYLALSQLAIAIFSAYMRYDVEQIINGSETNYITATIWRNEEAGSNAGFFIFRSNRTLQSIPHGRYAGTC